MVCKWQLLALSVIAAGFVQDSAGELQHCKGNVCKHGINYMSNSCYCCLSCDEMYGRVSAKRCPATRFDCGECKAGYESTNQRNPVAACAKVKHRENSTGAESKPPADEEDLHSKYWVGFAVPVVVIVNIGVVGVVYKIWKKSHANRIRGPDDVQRPEAANHGEPKAARDIEMQEMQGESDPLIGSEEKSVKIPMESEVPTTTDNIHRSSTEPKLACVQQDDGDRHNPVRRVENSHVGAIPTDGMVQNPNQTFTLGDGTPLSHLLASSRAVSVPNVRPATTRNGLSSQVENVLTHGLPNDQTNNPTAPPVSRGILTNEDEVPASFVVAPVIHRISPTRNDNGNRMSRDSGIPSNGTSTSTIFRFSEAAAEPIDQPARGNIPNSTPAGDQEQAGQCRFSTNGQNGRKNSISQRVEATMNVDLKLQCFTNSK